jgi:hypothetical protein
MGPSSSRVADDNVPLGHHFSWDDPLSIPSGFSNCLALRPERDLLISLPLLLSRRLYVAMSPPRHRRAPPPTRQSPPLPPAAPSPAPMAATRAGCAFGTSHAGSPGDCRGAARSDGCAARRTLRCGRWARCFRKLTNDDGTECPNATIESLIFAYLLAMSAKPAICEVAGAQQVADLSVTIRSHRAQLETTGITGSHAHWCGVRAKPWSLSGNNGLVMIATWSRMTPTRHCVLAAG